MSVSVIRAKGQLTIPRDVREAAHLEVGDPVEIMMTADGILLRPKKLIEASQAWFWTQDPVSHDLDLDGVARFEMGGLADVLGDRHLTLRTDDRDRHRVLLSSIPAV